MAASWSDRFGARSAHVPVRRTRLRVLDQDEADHRPGRDGSSWRNSAGSERAKRDEIGWSDRSCANGGFPPSLFSKAPFRFRPNQATDEWPIFGSVPQKRTDRSPPYSVVPVRDPQGPLWVIKLRNTRNGQIFSAPPPITDILGERLARLSSGGRECFHSISNMASALPAPVGNWIIFYSFVSDHEIPFPYDRFAPSAPKSSLGKIKTHSSL